ncbi:hypothetical protein MASR1M45_19360 [Candidatus Kapaibacterium sp.]
MTYKVFLILLAKILAAVAILIFSFSKSKAENPEWVFMLEGELVTDFVQQGDYMWIGTNNSRTFKFHIPTQKFVDTIDFAGDNLAIDSIGNLWLVSWNGIAKYDGEKLNIIPNTDIGISQNEHGSSVVIDKNGLVWIGMNKDGIASYNGENWKLYNYKNSDFPEYEYGVWDIAVDPINKLWLSVPGVGIVSFDGSTWSLLALTNSGLPSNKIFELKYDHRSILWIGSYDGFIEYDGFKWSLYTTTNSGIIDNLVYTFSIDKSNKIWMSTSKGIVVKDNNDWIVYSTENSDIFGNFAETFYVDSYNNKWIAVVKEMNSGVNIYREGGVVYTDVLENPYKNSFEIYPNPTYDFINIKLSNEKEFSYKIYDLLGNLVDSGSINESKINVTDLNSGFYTIQLTNGKNIHYSKFIKN